MHILCYKWLQEESHSSQLPEVDLFVDWIKVPIVVLYIGLVEFIRAHVLSVP